MRVSKTWVQCRAGQGMLPLRSYQMNGQPWMGWDIGLGDVIVVMFGYVGGVRNGVGFVVLTKVFKV